MLTGGRSARAWQPSITCRASKYPVLCPRSDAAGRDGSSGSDTGLRRARMADIAASRASVDATG